MFLHRQQEPEIIKQPRLEDVALACLVKGACFVLVTYSFPVPRLRFPMMVFNGKQETRNGMELFTNILSGSE